MHLFWKYIKMQKNGFALFLIFAAVFAVVFALYRLPVSSVVYAATICAFIGIIAILLGFCGFYRKHKDLYNLMQEIKVSADHLPAPHGVLEDDYQMLIRILLEDKLRLADEMTRRYTDLTDYFTVWVHQIKTPISSMKLTLQSDHSPEGREMLDELLRIEQYVEMVLCYLHMDAGSTDYVIKECDLDGIIRQAVRKFASQFIRRKLKLEYEPLHCTVLTDEKWLLFVIEQLLSNALKYTKYGTISITMDAPKTLCIRDTGIGIAPEDLPRLFEKGYTGYNGRSDKKSSGIGLNLCRRICVNLGHKINAYSAVGEGTVIKIDLERERLEVE